VVLLLGAGKAGYTGKDQDRSGFAERLVALGYQQTLPRPQVGLPRIPLQGLRAGYQSGVASAKAAWVLRFDFKELLELGDGPLFHEELVEFAIR
jgi:hypothetical protein